MNHWNYLVIGIVVVKCASKITTFRSMSGKSDYFVCLKETLLLLKPLICEFPVVSNGKATQVAVITILQNSGKKSHLEFFPGRKGYLQTKYFY